MSPSLKAMVYMLKISKDHENDNEEYSIEEEQEILKAIKKSDQEIVNGEYETLNREEFNAKYR
ncbi:MAG: hypothetical protein LBT66_06720 [Methanobrevibacter sp.]|jgi:hypothetical protein|nr:hypothetical protein [Candidatus Methanovirga meridionalis]